MTQTKYISSGGIAFSENKDMKKLRKYSLQGWHVKDFSFMGYTLEQGNKTDYIYSLDYRWLNKDEENEYFEFFTSSGWKHIASKGNIHLFRALPDTKPIYTDQNTTVEKYKNFKRPIMKLATPIILLTALLWLGTLLSSNTLESFLFTAAATLSVIAVPAAWTALRTISSKWMAEGKTKLANIMKALPFLLILAAVIILLLNRSVDSTVNVLTSAFIGGIAVPAGIWSVMSIYTNRSNNKK